MRKEHVTKADDVTTKDVDSLFDKLLAHRREKLKNVEALRRQIVARLDREIKCLYAKKNLVAQILVRSESLKSQKVGVLQKIAQNGLVMAVKYLISAPLIYAVVVPTIALHIILEIYHQVCFRLYGIPLVSPRDYFIFDRRHLPYLNWLEKINCFYCSYFNAFIAYAKEIGGRTERYWCPIKHAQNVKDQHNHYDMFVAYDEGEELRKRWMHLRSFKESQK